MAAKIKCNLGNTGGLNDVAFSKMEFGSVPELFHVNGKRIGQYGYECMAREAG